MAEITEDMLSELSAEPFDPVDWVEENFEEIELAMRLMRRVSMLGMFLPSASENFFFSGLSIGVQLGRRLSQIDTLNEKLGDDEER